MIKKPSKTLKITKKQMSCLGISTNNTDFEGRCPTWL